VGTDNRIYVSDASDAFPGPGQNQVLQVDPATKNVTATYDLTGTGAGGMVAVEDSGTPYIIVACSSGHLEAINTATGDVDILSTSVTATVLVRHEATDSYFATGYDSSFDLHTFHIEVSGGTPPTYSVTELTDGGNAFGGDDMLLNGGLLYIANYSYLTQVSKLYVLDPGTVVQTGYSPVSVMKDGQDGFVAMAVY
jgi:hypothetical protein